MNAFQPVGGTHADIAHLYDATTERGRGPRNDYYIDYRKIGPEEAHDILALTGMNVEGYVHSIDESAIRHILGGHGEGAETLAGSLPITRDDFLRIPEITASPDSIQHGRTRQGLSATEYRKRINGIIIYVEEARVGRKKLTAKTMWKTRAGGPTQPGVARTSETLLPPEGKRTRATGQAVPPAISIIGATAPKVKPGAGISDKQRAGGGPPAQQPPPTLRPNRTRPQAGRLDASAGPPSRVGPDHIIGAGSPEINLPEGAQ